MKNSLTQDRCMTQLFRANGA